MKSSLKFLLAASAMLLTAAPAYATNYNLIPSATGTGDYTYDIGATATGKGTFTDTFTFTIAGATNGFIDLGALNVANPTSNNNIDFVSAFLSGTPVNTPLAVNNMGPITIVSNPAEISVMAGLTYIVHVTYVAAAKNATFSGNISFTPTPTPEPAAWAMMLFGFGAIGAVLRRTSRSRHNLVLSYA